MGREFPGNTSPAGKPSVTARLTPTSRGTLAIHTGHGTGYAQTCAERTFPGKSGAVKNGATSKGGLTIHTGHGTEYSAVTSRG
jgi:hypothetical protein